MNQDQRNRLIGLLKENSRMSLADISRNLNVPIQEVYDEIRKLEVRFKFTMVEK